ncbi:MAG: DUF1015 domain-containing protein [Oscillospiraceae bacterium]
MQKSCFLPADILIPKACDLNIWSVIACDQFSSEREYWNRVCARAEGKPSTVHMIIPEAFLDTVSKDAAAERNAEMRKYLSSGVFKTIPESYVYVERETTNGIRRGLVGMIDLDAYDYMPDSVSPIRASEKTVVERLPARIEVRRAAPIELPHVMVLIDDPEKTVIEPLTGKKDSMEKLYDFDLMEGGGHIEGWRVTDEAAADVLKAFDCFKEKPVQIVVGDGNHSLAAAKACWESIKGGLSENERQDHPARFALVEANNVYDDGVCFEPIHRVVFKTEPEKLLADLCVAFSSGPGFELKVTYSGGHGIVTIPADSLGGMIKALQDFLEEYIVRSGGTIDYIHDDEAAEAMAASIGNIAFFMPKIEKSDLFSTVVTDGVFPKKSFSIGHARDKRYYLECRKIVRG